MIGWITHCSVQSFLEMHCFFVMFVDFDDNIEIKPTRLGSYTISFGIFIGLSSLELFLLVDSLLLSSK